MFMANGELDILLNVINKNHEDMMNRLDTVVNDVKLNTAFRHKSESKFNEIDKCIAGQNEVIGNISKTLQQLSTLRTQAEGSWWTVKNIWKIAGVVAGSAITGALINTMLKIYLVGY
jgi:hypothetical protein